ncbi:MAG: helix-turn-helix domain-containing protein [Oscillospiraceae bacterium]|jgi:carbohydrate diacid regulator|nr:helix-turn-helix domain-containing protein [Oscillospiraceae bacterium]
MSNRLFQGVLPKLSDATGRTVGMVDETGSIFACSDAELIGKVAVIDVVAVFEASEVKVFDGNAYCLLEGPAANRFYAVFVTGEDEAARHYVKLFAVTLGCMEEFIGERYDRANFIKNVILDNILPGDIYLRTRELHFNNEVPRVVLLIRSTRGSDPTVFEAIQLLFPDKAKDFTINVNETDIALVKEVRTGTETRDLEKLARSIADAVHTEYEGQPFIGIGSLVHTIPELAASYKEAQVSLEVGKVFDTEKKIISYDFLGIARLIYQLPKRLCGMFLQEVFKRGTIDSLDQETLFTIQKFFENNLNVSETSRKLFVHRNTLVYRLEKIKKLTGLDLREFDDAIVFKVALMVKKYLDARPTRY